MESARLSTGQKYENIPQIVETINLILPSIPHDILKTQTKIHLNYLKGKYEDYTKAKYGKNVVRLL